MKIKSALVANVLILVKNWTWKIVCKIVSDAITFVISRARRICAHNLREVSLLLFACLAAVPAHAVVISTTMVGHFPSGGYITSSTVANTVPVSSGDSFSLVLNYDDAVVTNWLYWANGTYYHMQTYQTSLIGGSGSLYDYEVANFSLNGGLDVLSQYLNQHSPSDNHQWGIGNLLLITNYPGPNGYGWVNYGGSNPLGVLIDSVTVAAVTSVPEPETYAMMMAGLGLLGFMARRRKQQQTTA